MRRHRVSANAKKEADVDTPVSANGKNEVDAEAGGIRKARKQGCCGGKRYPQTGKMRQMRRQGLIGDNSEWAGVSLESLGADLERIRTVSEQQLGLFGQYRLQNRYCPKQLDTSLDICRSGSLLPQGPRGLIG